jgi:DNA-binding Lrp family transcriptional regulator
MKAGVSEQVKGRGVENARMELIRGVQGGVPFVERPFAALGEKTGLSEGEVIGGLRELSEEGVLREISAVLEGSALGYDSALVCGRVPEEKLARAVEVINAHPTVTHNYLRGHEYNLWFTVAVPGSMSLDRTLELLAEEVGVDGFHPLRRTHTFKIGVNFDPESLKNSSQVVKSGGVEAVDVDEAAARKFRALQRPLSFEERPFEVLAGEAGTTEAALLEFAKANLGGAIRRYVGTLRHRKLGVNENGMVVWAVPTAEVEAVGWELAAAPEVSHCYARNAVEGFSYTVYSMVHGPTRESCYEVARALSKKTGQGEYAVLFSEKEFKKQRLRYFLPELDEWWAARSGVTV